MMNTLQAIGYGIVGFAVIIVIGIVVITKLGTAVGGEANTSAVYLSGQLGSTGLAGWIPAVIAVMIGGLFLAYFGGKNQKNEY